MGTFKITNITNTIGKRDAKFNTTINIEYVDKMMKKSIPVKAGDTIFLILPSLPLSVHSLRVKNLITVTEVGHDELAAEIAKITLKAMTKPAKPVKAEKVVETLPEAKVETEVKEVKKVAPKKDA